jgi:hypothetical protein
MTNFIMEKYKFEKGGNIDESFLYMVEFFLNETDRFETPHHCMQLFDDSQAVFSDYPLAITKNITPVHETDLKGHYDNQQSKAFPYKIFKYLGSDYERCNEFLIEGKFYPANYSEDGKFVIIYSQPLGYLAFNADCFSEMPDTYTMSDLTDSENPLSSPVNFAKGGTIDVAARSYLNRKIQNSLNKQI